MATHKVKTTHKIYLRPDLTGGDRGSLAAGTEVTVSAYDEKFGTMRVTDPKVGWGAEEYYVKIGEEEPIPPEPPVPQPGQGATIVLTEPDGRMRYFDERLDW